MPERILQLHLRRTFIRLFGLLLLLLAAITVNGVLLTFNQRDLSTSRDIQFASQQLADELRQSSGDLTNLVRAYVSTGDPKFETYYWEVLGIRNGEEPRPRNYHRIYWDLRLVDDIKPQLDGEPVSLRSLMNDAGFTPEELAMLDVARNESDDLVNMEMTAMNAMKGLFRDGAGEFTVVGEPDQELARRLVFSQEYFESKARIMQPIDNFYAMFEERTSLAVSKHLSHASALFATLLILTFLTLVVLVAFFAKVYSQVSELERLSRELDTQFASTKKANEEMETLSRSLEAKVKERTRQLEESEAVAKETAAEMEKFNKTMVGRELKMLELKNRIDELEEQLNSKGWSG